MTAIAQPGAQSPVLTARSFWIFFVLIAIVGAGIRIADSAAWRETGFDEVLYRRYVNMMDGGKQAIGAFQKDHTTKGYGFTVEGTGAMAMPDMVNFFLQTQRKPGSECELPPTRFLYIYTSWLWKNVQFGSQPPLPSAELHQPRIMSGVERLLYPGIWQIAQMGNALPFPTEAFPTGIPEDRSNDPDHRDPALASLHRVSCLFSVLLLVAGGIFAMRMLGKGAGLGVLALMACDPLQIHFSQHALIDGFFTFWAVMCMWTTWECLRNPRSIPWLAAHTACLALMVMTKENAFFVYCALTVAVASNVWLKFGTVTRRFVLLSLAGPLLGVAILTTLSGGIGPFIEVYQTLVAKAQNLAYAKLTGDGPWHRYLIDLLTVSPIVVCLALGALFAVVPRRKELAFFAVFVAASYLIMCNVRYGMNLRYASIWELPLRAAAFCMVWQMCARLGHRQWLGATAAIIAICGYEIRQYTILATNPALPLYETVTADLLRLQNVIKSAP